MAHLLNDPSHAVTEAIEGLCLERHQIIHQLPNCPFVIAVKKVSNTNVAIISGGGSGHEPMHGGFVAPGMLSAAVCGRVFASPPISHIRAAIDYLITNGAPSVLVMVKRYTGDIINFGAAVEASRQRYGPHRVDMTVIGDDVTFGGQDPEARGLAGTVLWYRLVTAAASAQDARLDLKQLKTLSDVTAHHIRSMGASLQSCTLPASSIPNAAIKEGEIELGLGIHGERGSKSIAFAHDADGLAERLIRAILVPSAPRPSEIKSDVSGVMSHSNDCSWIGKPGDQTAHEPEQLLVYVNNLGGTTNLELSVMVRSVLKSLASPSVGDRVAARIIGSGAACTSLNMHGISITAVNLTRLASDLTQIEGLSHMTLQMLEGLYLTTTAGTNDLGLGLAPSNDLIRNIISKSEEESSALADASNSQSSLSDEARALVKALTEALESLLGRCSDYNAYDAACGDGDTGTGVESAVKVLLDNKDSLLGPLATALTASTSTTDRDRDPLSVSFVAVGNTICDNMAGSMGALLAIFISGMVTPLLDLPIEAEGSSSSLSLMKSSTSTVAEMLRCGAAAVERVIGTVPGDRTFIDVTHALATALGDGNISKDKLPAVLRTATDSVSQMKARKGRARYLGGKEVGHRDPGAEIVADFVEAIIKAHI